MINQMQKNSIEGGKCWVQMLQFKNSLVREGLTKVIFGGGGGGDMKWVKECSRQRECSVPGAWRGSPPGVSQEREGEEGLEGGHRGEEAQADPLGPCGPSSGLKWDFEQKDDLIV